MNIAVGKIKVADRIRKLTAGIDELAKDIRKNGLINPITVMMVERDGQYQLLAGLRRLRAAQSLGWEEIAVTVVAPKDAEAVLNIEYSENVQREAFTFSEKIDYARLIEEIERAKAKERMLSGKKEPDPGDQGPQGARIGKSREVVGEKIGMSGRQYDRAKYVADHAPSEVIEGLDRGERKIRRTYDQLRAVEREEKTQAQLPEPDTSLLEPPVAESDLDRAIRAERELDAFKYRQHNEIYHRDTVIENLKARIAELETVNQELEAALDAANARIQELEGENNAGTTL